MPAIYCNNLGKHYQLQAQRYFTLRDCISGWIRKSSLCPGPGIWALRNIEIAIEEGQVVGLIGGNGAGKSTLLKLLSRITHPSEGRITVRGRIGSLLEVGTGFHPELTGRENIFLAGSVIGMSRREILRHFDAIIEFADVSSHLDTPVKRYSSGMQTRLAFAIAAHLDSDILLVDEVLAVGDARFQQRCLGKMDAIRSQGRTIIFVSHNMQSIRALCTTAIWLDKGTIVEQGRCDDVIASYLSKTTSAAASSEIAQRIATIPPDPCFRLLDIRIDQQGPTGGFTTGRETRIIIDYEVLKDTEGLRTYFVLCDNEGQNIFRSFAHGDSPTLPLAKRGRFSSTAVIPADFLAPIRYRLHIGASIYNLRKCLPHEIEIPIQVEDDGLIRYAYSHSGTIGVMLAPRIAWETRVLAAATD